MRANEILIEKASRGRPIVAVDIQPTYTPLDSVYDGYLAKTGQFLARHNGPILMYVNADETGMTTDNIEHEIFPFWDQIFEWNGDDFFEGGTFDNMEWFDKGYGYLRSWMDTGIKEKYIIRVIREMYRQHVSDTRMLFNGDEDRILEYLTPVADSINTEPDTLLDDPLTVGWAAIDQLKRYNNCYLIGGGRNECLKEVALLMNAFNIKYKMINELIY